MKKHAKTVSILLSITMIVVTVFAIVFFSYSWYIRAKNATVTSITFASSGSEGIQLSADAENWKDTLHAVQDLQLDENLKFDSISTSAAAIDGKINFYNAFFTNEGFSTVLLSEEEKLYHSFDIYILNSQNVTKQLTLSNQSSVTDTNNSDIALSTRVAFINLGNSNNAEDAILLNGEGISNVDYIWEPNSTSRNKNISLYHRNYISEGKSVYQGVDTEVGNSKLEDGLIVNSEENQEHVKSVQTFDPAGAGQQKEILLLQALTITKIRLYIWVEGQDIDCTNSVSGGTADIYLNFNTYDLVWNGETYIPIEQYQAPTLSHVTNVTYSWNPIGTDISQNNLSVNYLVKISSVINNETIIVRSLITDQTSININQLLSFSVRRFGIQVKAITPNFADGEFSNQLQFTILSSPTQLVLSGSTLEWQPVNNSISYTLKARNKATGQELTASASSISINLSTALFGGQPLIAGEYFLSIRANGGEGFANSIYSTNITYIVL